MYHIPHHGAVNRRSLLLYLSSVGATADSKGDEVCQASLTPSIYSQRCRKEELYQILIRKNCIKSFYYLVYTGAISKTIFKMLKCKLVSKYSGCACLENWSPRGEVLAAPRDVIHFRSPNYTDCSNKLSHRLITSNNVLYTDKSVHGMSQAAHNYSIAQRSTFDGHFRGVHIVHHLPYPHVLERNFYINQLLSVIVDLDSWLRMRRNMASSGAVVAEHSKC
jgi:hypothetical protein